MQHSIRRGARAVAGAMAVINALALSACASTPAPVSAGTADPQPAVAAAPAAEPATPRVETGNGERNRIETSGVTRNGRIFTIPEVTLEHNGWLVLHPFRDGRPVGEIYAGATYLPGGTHQNVAVTAQTVPMPEPGTMFIVMLHSDVNNDETFDFVFVDERNVADKAVFEGGKMIGHAIAAP